MMGLLIIIGLALLLLSLVRRGLIQVDLSVPWLLALVVFGILSLNEGFVNWAGVQLGILYAPIAIIFCTIAILLGLITVLLMAVTRLRFRQIEIIRRLAAMELARQEDHVRARDAGGPAGDFPIR
jgi:hypothetical protein